MGEDSKNHYHDENEQPSLENDANAENRDKIGPTVGSLDPLQPTLDLEDPPSLDESDDEEFAGELTADDFDEEMDEDDEANDGALSNAVGWVAIVLAAISFFIMPVILGAAGIIVGFVARSRDAKTLGTVAIVGGAAAILISLFARPFI